MDLFPMQVQAFLRVARNRIVPIGVLAVLLGIAGCKGFFVPLCVEYNTCTSTTTTGTTGTTSTTATTGTTSTTATTGTTSTTATTGTTSTSSTTGTTSTTSTTASSPITPSGSNSSFLYISNANTGTIGTFAVASGKVSSVAQSTVNAPASPTAIAATPDGRLLYLATNDGAVYVDIITTDGNLQAGNHGNPVTHVAEPTWMSMDRSGKWLFVASSASGSLEEFQVDAGTGALRPASQSPVLDSGKPTEVYLTPDNQRLLVALGKGGVDAFSFDPSTGAVGMRQHIVPLHAGLAADNVLTSDNASRNLYVGEAGTGIRAFSMVGGVTLQEISGSPFGSPQTKPTSMVVNGSAGTLLVANSTMNSITQYTIAANGTLAVVSRSTSSADSSPTALTLDRSGKNVLSTSKNAVPDLAHLPTK